MAKSKETQNLENLLFEYNRDNSFFCIFECTIGFGGGGRVDCISVDTRGCIRCFEIKVTKSDFHSKHGHNFIGNLNYYVMPYKLYKEVKNEIPNNIGVIVSNVSNDTLSITKSAKKMELKEPLYKIELYIIRSLFREYEKSIYAENKELLASYKRIIHNLKTDRDSYKNRLFNLNHNIRNYLGDKYENFKKWIQNN